MQLSHTIDEYSNIGKTQNKSNPVESIFKFTHNANYFRSTAHNVFDMFMPLTLLLSVKPKCL